MNVKFTDNSKIVLASMQKAKLIALEKCGLTAEGYAKRLCPVDKGNLRNSIAHQVDEGGNAVYVGTNSEYGAYVELGTGKYYPGGRYGWWVYVAGGANESAGGSDKRRGSGKSYTYEEAKRVVAILRSKGLDAHMTEGRPAKPYLKPAVADHVSTYRKIFKDDMENG